MDVDEPPDPRPEPYRLLRLLERPRAAARRRMPLRWRRRAAVFIGSAAGSGLRAGVGLVLPGAAGWPWATLTANVSGALVLGYLLTRFQAAGSTTTLTIPLLCTGVLGGYTTFSALAVETHALLAAGRAGLAALYVAVSVAGGYMAALLGVRVAEVRA